MKVLIKEKQAFLFWKETIRKGINVNNSNIYTKNISLDFDLFGISINYYYVFTFKLLSETLLFW